MTRWDVPLEVKDETVFWALYERGTLTTALVARMLRVASHEVNELYTAWHKSNGGKMATEILDRDVYERASGA